MNAQRITLKVCTHAGTKMKEKREEHEKEKKHTRDISIFVVPHTIGNANRESKKMCEEERRKYVRRRYDSTEH